jgi:hypothetical protein
MASIKSGTNAGLMLFLLILIGFSTYLQQFCTPVMLPLIGRDLGPGRPAIMKKPSISQRFRGLFGFNNW